MDERKTLPLYDRITDPDNPKLIGEFIMESDPETGLPSVLVRISDSDVRKRMNLDTPPDMSIYVEDDKESSNDA